MTTLVFDPSARRLEDGRVLVGGHPTRLLRLTPAGARMVDAWRGGSPVGDGEGARRLAQRLIHAGLAHPRPTPGAVRPDDVAIVIPTRDRLPDLARLGPCREIVIVDDGSSPPLNLKVPGTFKFAPRRDPAPPGGVRNLKGSDPLNFAPAPGREPTTPRGEPATPRGEPAPPGGVRNLKGSDPFNFAPAPGREPVAPGGAPVRVVRRERSGGPAAARNAGLAATDAPFIAFLDSDVVPTPGWLEPLLAHFADPELAAVAPRVRVPPGASALARYEAARSPLDLGPHPGVVGPGRRVGYVPAAALVVRRAALVAPADAVSPPAAAPPLAAAGPPATAPPAAPPLAAAGPPASPPAAAPPLAAAAPPAAPPPAAVAPPAAAPRAVAAFDEALRFGEDVDLVWRLAAGGWTVRYEPLGVVEHPHRGSLRAWLGQRFAYGSSAGALARRHRGRMRHLVVPREAFRLPERRFARLAFEARVGLARQVGEAVWRPYALALLPTKRGRRVLATALAANVAGDYATRRPALDPLRFAALRAGDDLAYAAGVWAGCLRARTAGPLVPASKYPKLDHE
jgi:glycosyltransferase involved in cell wall biosynthesis